ncbi:hypothetical protein [Micromonospora arborensis]|uniref:hypothetical protein n=1 Tax=Micromonospora arborensis TaxID=2116518 RepID=UPI0037130198
MAEMSMTWTLHNHGWAVCQVADQQAEAKAVASYVTNGPEQLLAAVTNVVVGAPSAHAEFEAEPTAYRWTLQRRGPEVEIRLLEATSDRVLDHASRLIWSSSQPVDTLARVVVRAFDAVASRHGEDGYEATWGRPFPRTEVNALRAAWHGSRQSRP